MQIIIAILLAAAVAIGGARALKHESDITPALVTPSMDLHAEFSGDLSARAYRLLHGTLTNNTEHPKLIALTFDDGPYPMFTPLLLDELRAQHVPATFFLIGRDAEQWPEITRRIEADGNEIANHTYSHPNLDQETSDEVKYEVLHGRDVLWNITHDMSIRDMMRPPHGRYTASTLRTVQSLGYQVVLWTDDSATGERSRRAKSKTICSFTRVRPISCCSTAASLPRSRLCPRLSAASELRGTSL
jgi:peptidoglycan/xylan/chitin deacetylase (PgdA/CDA1 family)